MANIQLASHKMFTLKKSDWNVLFFAVSESTNKRKLVQQTTYLREMRYQDEKRVSSI